MRNLKQVETFEFIKGFYHNNSYMPSLREIAEHFGSKSVSSQWQKVEALVKDGYLVKQKNSPRAIKLTAEIDLINFIKNFNPKLFSHPKQYKNLIKILLNYKEQFVEDKRVRDLFNKRNEKTKGGDKK